MASLATLLPTPKNEYQVYDEAPSRAALAARHRQTAYVPPYLHRRGFVPRKPEDFGDGGAFPEIHVAQFPLDLGRPDRKSSRAIVQVNQEGEIDFDALLHQGRGKDKVIHSKFTDLVEVRKTADQLQKPGMDEEIETANRTRAALEKIVNKKIAMARPVQVPEGAHADAAPAKYIRYTPSSGQLLRGNNSGAKQRVIRLVETPVDPMEPPKFRHKKVPRGPPSPPVPIMHSPTRKVSAADQKAWSIPPCVSNWKNAKGYVIPLDKRLAADGRSLQEVSINDKFAKLSEALYIAEREAREEVKMRAKVQKRIVVKEKEQKEQELRQMAAQAREKRAKLMMGKAASDSDSDSDSGSDAGSEADTAMDQGEDLQDVQARRDRDKLRRDRRRERERELRMAKLGKKSGALRDADRDISEKIALGMHTAGQGGEDMFDARLFNQSEGVGSGFGEDDAYNVYSKPLFQDKTHNIYRPKKGDSDVYGDAEEQYTKLRDTSRFKPEKDFEGVDRSAPTQRRTEPVQFEKVVDPDADTFDTSAFASGGNKPSALDGIGTGGTMKASGGGGITDTTGSHAGTSKIRFQRGEARPSSDSTKGATRSPRRSRSPRRRSRSPVRRKRSRSPRRRRSRSGSPERRRRRSRSGDRRRRRRSRS